MYKKGDIVERTPGYTNQMMIDDCERMLRVLQKTKKIYTGRGRNRVEIEAPFYRDVGETIKRIKRSIDYYKDEF